MLSLDFAECTTYYQRRLSSFVCAIVGLYNLLMHVGLADVDISQHFQSTRHQIPPIIGSDHW